MGLRGFFGVELILFPKRKGGPSNLGRQEFYLFPGKGRALKESKY